MSNYAYGKHMPATAIFYTPATIPLKYKFAKTVLNSHLNSLINHSF